MAREATSALTIDGKMAILREIHALLPTTHFKMRFGIPRIPRLISGLGPFIADWIFPLSSIISPTPIRILLTTIWVFRVPTRLPIRHSAPYGRNNGVI